MDIDLLDGVQQEIVKLWLILQEICTHWIWILLFMRFGKFWFMILRMIFMERMQMFGLIRNDITKIIKYEQLHQHGLDIPSLGGVPPHTKEKWNTCQEISIQ